MAFIQTRWHIWHIVLLAFSIASWFVIAVFINSFALIDYEWYQVLDTVGFQLYLHLADLQSLAGQWIILAGIVAYCDCDYWQRFVSSRIATEF